MRLIETDAFPFEFLSRLAERESWRKEIHRPVYHVHKWWAKRLGSVFRGILLGSILPEHADFRVEFYKKHDDGQVVFDPFMGSGTTIGEAHKLGMTAIGRDINPVAVEAVFTALGPMDRTKLKLAFNNLNSLDRGAKTATTRHAAEVQDASAERFAAKMRDVFGECHRVLKDDGLLVFSYHHYREEGWQALADALLGAGFNVVNSHPVKAEMSVATPKSQAKEPIQLDIVLVCRKQGFRHGQPNASTQELLTRARNKLLRLAEEGFSLSHNDRKIVYFGQFLTAISAPSDLSSIAERISLELKRPLEPRHFHSNDIQQKLLFKK